MNIGGSVNNDFKNKCRKLWIDLDYNSQNQFFFAAWISIQTTVDSNELIPTIHSEIINNYGYW